MSEDPALRIAGLTKRYGAHRGIEGVDLEVGKGEILGFLGPNGAGKTTTIRILLDLIRPTAGQAFILGRDCQVHSENIRREVGYVPGEYSLYGDLTGRQTLRYFSSLRGALDPEHLGWLAEQLDVDLDRRLSALSHGNRQKVALVAALLPRPTLLILDEPTTGLDPLIQQRLYRLLEEARAEGATIFFSSHVLPEVERICDRVAMIREGALIGIEDVMTLKAKSPRRLQITLDGAVPREELERLPQLSRLQVDGQQIHCQLHGDMGPLLALLSPLGVRDLLSHELGIEDLFLSIYGEGRAE